MSGVGYLRDLRELLFHLLFRDEIRLFQDPRGFIIDWNGHSISIHCFTDLDGQILQRVLYITNAGRNLWKLALKLAPNCSKKPLHRAHAVNHIAELLHRLKAEECLLKTDLAS